MCFKFTMVFTLVYVSKFLNQMIKLGLYEILSLSVKFNSTGDFNNFIR